MMSENALSLLTRAIDQARRLSIADLRLVRRELCRIGGLVAIWQSRAVTEVRKRMQLVKRKNWLEEANRKLLNKAYSWQVDNHGIRLSYGMLYADENMIRMSLEGERDELIAAIQRLPEPPVEFGDGPDERVGWILQEHRAWKEAAEQNLRFTQHIKTKLEETTKMGEELIDERDRIIGHLEADLAHERETVTFLDASFDVKQRLVVAEATLASIRERAERVQEGESWDLTSFVLSKTTAQHTHSCWKNQAFRGLGVGGVLASCTCGAEKKD